MEREYKTEKADLIAALRACSKIRLAIGLDSDERAAVAHARAVLARLDKGGKP